MRDNRRQSDVADQVCPDCGGKLRAKASKFDSSERITVTERTYTVVVDEKQVYAYAVYKNLVEEAKQIGLDLNDDRPWQPQFALYICWSHARRPFDNTPKTDSEADVGWDLIGALHEVEARVKKLANGDEAKFI